MKKICSLLSLLLIFSCKPESKNENPSFSLNDLKAVTDSILTFNDFSREEYTANFDRHESEFKSLESYFLGIIPDSTEVELEFKNNSELEILAIRKMPNLHERTWNIKIGSEESDSLFSLIGWEISYLDTLYTMLQKIDCISISNFDNTVIGYKRSGLSKYSYKIFDHLLSKKEIEKHNSCMYIFYRDNIVLEYGSGAIGSICFPERYREKQQLTSK